MKPGVILTYDSLRASAENAVAESGMTQTALAEALGVTQGAVSRAVREVGPGRAALQMRIIQRLTGFELRDIGGFIVEAKD